MADEERLAQIEAREKAATAGPWRWYTDTDEEVWPDGEGSPYRFSLRTTWERKAKYWEGTLPIFVLPYVEIGHGNSCDPEFIAHARQDVPWLIERVRDLEARLQTLHEARCAWRERAINAEDAASRVRGVLDEAEALFDHRNRLIRISKIRAALDAR